VNDFKQLISTSNVKFQFDNVDSEKLKQFLKSSIDPKIISDSVKSLKPDVRKQILSFYNEIIPQMPDTSLLRTRFEQAREVLSDPDHISEGDFILSPEVQKEMVEFYNDMIPQISEDNLMRQGFEIGRDLITSGVSYTIIIH